MNGTPNFKTYMVVVNLDIQQICNWNFHPYLPPLEAGGGDSPCTFDIISWDIRTNLGSKIDSTTFTPLSGVTDHILHDACCGLDSSDVLGSTTLSPGRVHGRVICPRSTSRTTQGVCYSFAEAVQMCTKKGSKFVVKFGYVAHSERMWNIFVTRRGAHSMKVACVWSSNARISTFFSS